MTRRKQLATIFHNMHSHRRSGLKLHSIHPYQTSDGHLQIFGENMTGSNCWIVFT